MRALKEIFPHGVVLVASLLASAVVPLAAATDLSHGERQFNRNCKVCHTVGPSEPHRQGPNLHGLFNRRSGSVEDFYGYSYNMRQLEIVWNEETLDRYLAEGRDFVRGTTMRMANIRDEEDRRAIIAYLREATQ